MNSASSAAESGVRFWQSHVRALAGSGLSRREYCHRHHLSYHALTYWVRKLRPSSSRASLPALVEVPLPLVQRPPFRLRLGQGRQLEIEPDFDEAGLARLLAILEQR